MLSAFLLGNGQLAATIDTMWLLDPCARCLLLAHAYLQASRETALRASEGRAGHRRDEQDALAVILTQREAAVLEKERAAQVASRSAHMRVCVCVMHACMHAARQPGMYTFSTEMLPAFPCAYVRVSGHRTIMFPTGHADVLTRIEFDFLPHALCVLAAVLLTSVRPSCRR